MPKRFQTPDVATPAGLDASERRAREIIEGLRDAFMSVDADWRVTDCNARAEAILGQGRAGLVGRSLWDVIGVPPDSQLGDVARRVKRTGVPEEIEFTLARNGEEHLLNARGFPLGDGLGVTAGDITELRAAERRLAESEARFRELAVGAPVPTWMTRSDGTIDYVNPAMQHALARDPDEITGTLWERHLHPEDAPAFQQAMRKARSGHGRLVCAPRFQRGDGAWRVLQLTGVPRFDPQGFFAGHVGMATDITDVLAAQKRQELLINELNHRVRNTLATVQSIVRQTLKDSPAAKGTLDLLNERLMALAAAHDVLTRESWAGAELSEMARQAVRTFDPDARRITISGPKVRLYPGAALALFLALNELATNAVRHGALSGPEGHVSLTWTRQDAALDLEWRESGGPPVSPPTRKGFGSRLLGAGLVSELGAPAEITYAPEGLVCRIQARLPPG